MTFDLQGHEFIELNKLLKITNLAASGGEANAFITEGKVKVNGQKEIQKRKKLRKGDKVTFGQQTIELV
jgi:ribosome-associated protein